MKAHPPKFMINVCLTHQWREGSGTRYCKAPPKLTADIVPMKGVAFSSSCPKVAVEAETGKTLTCSANKRRAGFAVTAQQLIKASRLLTSGEV